MDDLKRYVDKLFAGHKETREVRELRDEILGNLEARVADHMEEGMTYDEAVAQARRYLDTVDYLIPEQKPVYRNRYMLELLQAGLLYTVIAWILTIPLRVMFVRGLLFNNLLFLAVIILGVVFLALSSRKDEAYLNAVAPVNKKRLTGYRKAAWLIWALFMLVMTAFTTAVRFGSDIWFGRAVHISGPYQFAVIAAAYAMPFITIILPLLFSKACTLAEKHEVDD
ncbi:MAG TPA: permease prefix domain 1-containing protein [Bacillota bacterium]|jgi:hypothetical protein|nr:hypothetical protein [Bacillota bacterium]HOA35731.1 permease prefix domain 1-containing protein [Bacillota bacterium]HOJ84606.1 permease prefix domain 1-containing protein [Bacillota bacterium]HOL15476.1 permease prefix domain 1-containing protein [Bacillota bacterium]HPZ11791.1 permease prefix domain 1-containing protein [Bacillota bacterium]